MLCFSACTFATQTFCLFSLPNSYCDLGTLLCECAVGAGYVENDDGSRCNYGKLFLFCYKILNSADGRFFQHRHKLFCQETLKDIMPNLLHSTSAL